MTCIHERQADVLAADGRAGGGAGDIQLLRQIAVAVAMCVCEYVYIYIYIYICIHTHTHTHVC